MLFKRKPLERHHKIGGWLWLPAIWTVTNTLTAGYYITLIPAIGWLLMAFAVANAYLFWTRSVLYRWYFVLQTFALLVLLSVISGPRAVGSGSAMTILMMFGLLFSSRARGTFVEPLWRRRSRASASV